MGGIVLSLLAPARAAGPGSAGTEFPADVLAVVGGEAITLEDFDQALGLSASEFAAAAAWQMDDIRRAVLAELIDRKVLLQEARRRGLAVSAAEMSADLARENKSAEEASDPPLDPAARKREGEDLLIRRLLRASVWVRKPSRGDLEEYYWRNLGSFRRPERIRARQIVARKAVEAETLRGRLEEGEDFAKVAQASSLGEESGRGGELGWVSSEDLPPELWRVLQSLEPGRISEPVKTEWGYHILKSEGRSPARMLSPEEAAPDIEAEWLQADEERALHGLSEELRSRAEIRVNPEFAPFAAEKPVKKPTSAKAGAAAKPKSGSAGKSAPVKTKKQVKTPALGPGKAKQ